MATLGLGNAIISEKVQVPYYPEFANFNTYGIKALNDTEYNYAKFALNMKGGCMDQMEFCLSTNHSTLTEQAICTEAANMCRDNVEGIYETMSGRGVYDIRHPAKDPTPPSYFVDYLNTAAVQNALGVDLNYTAFSNTEIYYAFQQTGDFIYNDFLLDLEDLLSRGVRVQLYYGDADYICNWFGGEAVSLAVNYTDAAAFRASGYTPFLVNGIEYGEVRQHGNFSFLRVYEAGHEVPYYQPAASLAMFQRVIEGKVVADGSDLTADYSSSGDASATHTEPASTLAPAASSGGSASASSTAAATTSSAVV